MKVKTLSLSLQLTLPNHGTAAEQGLTYSFKPSFGATVELEEGEDADTAAKTLYRYVEWHLVSIAKRTDRMHTQLSDQFHANIRRFLQKNPEPPALANVTHDE